MFVQGLLFIILFLTVDFLIGTLCLSLCKKPAAISGAFIWGFAVLLALFQIVAYPMMKLHMAFLPLFWSFGAVALGLAVYAAYRLVSRREYRLYWRRAQQLVGEARTMKLLFGLAVLFFLAQMVLALGFQYISSDDSYYFPRASLMVSTNQLSISDAMSWIGEESSAYARTSDASTLEAFRACLSYATGMPVAVVSKIYLSAVVTLLSALAAYALAGQLLGKERGTLKTKALFMVAYILVMVLGTALNRNASHWAVRFPWIGKGILISFVFPMLFLICAIIVQHGKEEIPGADWVLAAVVLAAGVMVSVVGAFLPFILYFTLGLPYLLLYQRKRLLRLLPWLLLSVLPVIVFSGLTFAEVMTSNRMYLTAFKTPDWKDTFADQMGGYHYFFLVLYIAGLAYTAWKGNRVARLLLIGGPIALFLTFLNPLLVGVVSKYVTTGEVYWRLYWLLPMAFVPAFALADGLGRLKLQQLNAAIISAAALCVLVVGYGVGIKGIPFKEDVYRTFPIVQLQRKQNLYGLRQATVEMGRAILRDYSGEGQPRLLTSNEEINLIRQYSTDILLVDGLRPEQRKEFVSPIQGTDMLERDFLTAFQEGKCKDPELFIQTLKTLRVDYIAISYGDPYEQLTPAMKEKLEQVTRFEEFELWKVPR